MQGLKTILCGSYVYGNELQIERIYNAPPFSHYHPPRTQPPPSKPTPHHAPQTLHVTCTTHRGIVSNSSDRDLLVFVSTPLQEFILQLFSAFEQRREPRLSAL